MHVSLTAFPPDQAAIVRTVAPGGVLQIGRADDSGLCIAHPSVSRVHARLSGDHAGWRLHDPGSKNGSFVDGQRVPCGQDYALGHAGWLRFGDVYCEFALLGPAQAAAIDDGRQARRIAANARTARLEGVQNLDALLDASLRGVLELAQCERGFVLLRQGDGFAVRASLALDVAALGTRGFSGSIGAVRRALESGGSVVANDIAGHAWLASRASVAAAGLCTLVCLPLHDGDAPLGAIYADRTRPGPPITTLDQELLEAFAERAALWIAARRTSELLASHAAAAGDGADWARILAAHGGGAGGSGG